MRSDKSVRSIRSIQTAKVGYLVISAALCILGVLLIAYPAISAKALCYILGGVLTVYGIIKMVGYFSKDLYRLAFQYDLASGALITALGVIMLLRAANPQIIAVDEITQREDLYAVSAAANCGVTLLATIHAGSMEELRRKPLFARLLRLQVFERAVLITRQNEERRYQVERL